MADRREIVLRDVSLPEAARDRGIDVQQWNAVTRVIWPNASAEIKMVAWDYCKAKNLDPIKRPVHIVQTWDDNKRAYVESIWEGIGAHRITAARTGEYAGQDEPEFGPMVRNSAWKIEYPEWCKVSVYRMVKGQKCKFTAVTFWEECVALRGKERTPNSMWLKRRRGQIAKCAEAAALRLAFPEEIGSMPTYDEMEQEGHHLVEGVPTMPVIEQKRSALDKLEAVVSPGAAGEVVDQGFSPSPESAPRPPYVGEEFDLPDLEPELLAMPDGATIKKEKGALAKWGDAWLTAKRESEDAEGVQVRFKADPVRDLYYGNMQALHYIDKIEEQISA